MPGLPKINILSPFVADLIAAGEVVERPASVVKELLENAVDAGARNVTLELRGGGREYIRVTDDGCGMSPEDAGIAFLRHATSKLSDARGLEAIGTLGFRGEALAAISSVSHIELSSCERGAGLGVRMKLDAGEISDMYETGCPEGTTMIVRGLFYNTPARLKFMKTDRAEGAACVQAALRCALGRPDVSFRCIRDGREEFFTPGDGRRDSAVYALLGRELAEGTERFGKRYGVRRIPVVKRQALAGYDPRALKGTGVTCATSPMGGDHTAGNTIGMPGLDPLGTAGQVEASRAAQTLMAVFDSLGMCIFSAMPSEDAAVFGLVGEMLAGVYGGSWTPDDVLALGRQTLENEKRFNAGAHIDASEDDVPAFMREEALPPHDSVFDIPREQLASTLDFSAGQRG